MGKPRRYKPYIIIEAGRQKYTSGKMQSAGIFMEIMTDEGLEDKIRSLPPIRNKQADASFYLIGSDGFTDRVKTLICSSGFRGTVSRDFSDEDSCMKAIGCKFPESAPTMTKEPTRRSVLQDEFAKISHGSDIDSSIAAVMVAADELKGYKISPPTPENIRKALVSRTKLYLQDPEDAEASVDRYLASVKNTF